MVLVGAWNQQQQSVSFGLAGEGEFRRQGLHFSASSLDRSLAGWCHHHSAALRLLLTRGTCCSAVLINRAVESVPAMSSTLPRDEGHTRTHTRRLMHIGVEVYTNLCSHVHSHNPADHKSTQEKNTCRNTTNHGLC